MYLAIASECKYALLSSPALRHAIDTGTSIQLERRVADAYPAQHSVPVLI